ncbi:MAG: DNA alkylation repair protein [Ethanoligenens sp.]
MNRVEEEFRHRLFELQDLKYKAFHCKLMPTVSPDTVIGVRTPQLRKLSKELSQSPEAAHFLTILPHTYYEENNLHGFLIETIKDYDPCIAAVETFLPYINNWATCDLMSPKAFKKHLPALYGKIPAWLQSGRTYTVRFGIGMLMKFYLDAHFRPEMLELVASVRSDEYYVNMMIAWYFATALAKQYEATLPYMEERRLEKWTHNKTIQKAVESYRISDEAKNYLRTIKIK